MLWLVAPNFYQPFKMAIDAGEYGEGAVLLQDGADGMEHCVSYFSRKVQSLPAWLLYNWKKEGLTMVLALEHPEAYIGSSSGPITIYTDHNLLLFAVHA